MLLNSFDLPIDSDRLGVLRDVICLNNHHSQEPGKDYRGKSVLEIIKMNQDLKSFI